MKTQSDTSRCGPALLGDSRVLTLRSPRVVEYQECFRWPLRLSRAGLRDCGTTDFRLPPSAEDTAMPPTRGKKRSSRDTQKQNVNDPREGATRVVTVASGHHKGQKKTQKLQHTPGGANLASW